MANELLLPPAERARLLLAKELHREYRAAEKALRTTDVLGRRPYYQHDHGWDGCHRQKYFTERAALVIKRAACHDPQTLCEAEQALDATILIRRLMVEGKIPFPEADAGERSTDRFSRTVGDAVKPDLASGGLAPVGLPYLVGESATDAADYLSDAQKKQIRDAVIRREVFKPKTYTVLTFLPGETPAVRLERKLKAFEEHYGGRPGRTMRTLDGEEQ